MDILCRQQRRPFPLLNLDELGALLLRPILRQTVNTFATERLYSLVGFLKASIDHTIYNIGI